MKKYKRLYIALLISMVTAGNALPQWIAENSPVSVNLNSISMTDENHLWIVGDKGTMLYRDKDAWVEYSGITDKDLYSVFLTGRETGWAVGDKGTILRLSGSGWEVFPSPTTEKLFSVSFRDENHGYASGANGTILVYSDGTWQPVKNKIRAHFYALAYMGDICFIGGGMECRNVPVLQIAYNENHRLDKVYNTDFTEIKSLSISPDKHAWAVGHQGRMFYFNGYSWEEAQTPENLASLNFVSFSGNNMGIAVGYNGRIMTYSGEVWENEESNVTARLNGAVLEENACYAIGNNGTILKSVQTRGNEPVIPVHKAILDVSPFPNPSTGYVKFTKPEDTNDDERIILTVSNSNGQVVLQRYIQGLTGDQEYRVDTGGLASGLYIIHLKSPSFSASGRFSVNN
jgi:photosystem II stability/assembly factor-like uncharacterized protein